MRPLSGSTRLRFAALLACLPFLAQTAYGVQGTSLSLPFAPKTSAAGLSLGFDCSWADGSGYVPIRLTVNCVSPPASDRKLAVEITTRNRSERRPVTVTADVEIPAGTNSLTKVIHFPRFSNGFMLSMKVWEDGVRLDDLSFEDVSMYTNGTGQGSTPSTLFVSSQTIDVSQFNFLTMARTYVPPGSPPQVANTIATVAPFAQLAVLDLFEDWMCYSSLDVVFISATDVELLAASRPAAWRALQQWTWSGGNLCVYDVGNDWHGLAALDEKLQSIATKVEADDVHGNWIKPKAELYNVDISAQAAAGTWVDPAAAAAASKGKARLPKAPKKPPFVWKNARMGMVFALASADPFPGKSVEWQWLFNTIDPNRWNWHARHGLPVGLDASNFDGFLIGDVGLPPVKSYRVLITLFVIGIGPVNYWLLRRRGRLHLLLFTVPAAAIVVSAALLGYAVVADGFDNHLRARSYTELDQRHDEAVSWARLSYYVGLSPSGGLVFPADTAVYPLDRDLDMRRVHPERWLTWTDEEHLARGWLASRTPTQYMTVRPYACRRELAVVESADSSDCAVENRLGTRVEHLMLRSAADKLYYGNNIEPGARATLRHLETEATSEAIMRVMFSARNRDPIGFPGTATTPVANLFFGPSYSRRYPRGANYGLSSNNAASLLEAGLGAAFDDVGSRLREPRTYVAIVGRPPDVVTGIGDAVESQSLHVIFGNW